MESTASFGYWIRRQRKALDLTQQVLADRVGCSLAEIKKIEGDERKPSRQIAERLADSLSVPADQREVFVECARGLRTVDQLPLARHPGVRAATRTRTPQSSRHNLPLQLTSFIGRKTEITDVIHLLEKARLVTLTGPGGTGKTRLAIQVADEIKDQYSNGVWIVELAPISDPLLIPHLTANALGLRDKPAHPVIDMLCDYLREKKLLLLLDNCEHLIEACAEFADILLHACPHTRIVATSREPLSIAGETSYLVPSLQLPDVQNKPTVETLNQYEASRLFIERATAQSQQFTVTDENASSIAQICHHVDGIPLAIELAAGKIRILSTQQIAQRLNDRFHLLIDGSRTELPRHQTLQAAIDWSYNLLSLREQTLFRRLSVFVNSWTLEAAEEVCAGDGIELSNILDLLAQLVSKSLVLVTERSQNGETRYHMLETIQQYAREKLLEAGDRESIRQRHLAYFVKLVEKAEPELYHSNQVFWLNKLDDELDNLRSALDWALASDIETGLRLMVIPKLFWQTRANLREVSGKLSQLLTLYSAPDSLHIYALIMSSECIAQQGDFTKARMIAEQSLELARRLSDKTAEAFSLSHLGHVMTWQGDLENGIPLIEESLALYRELENKFGQAMALHRLSTNKNDLEHAITFAREGLLLHRESDNPSGIAYSLFHLAELIYYGGDFSSPAVLLEEARAIFRQLGNQDGETLVLNQFGRLAFCQGDYVAARAYYGESIALGERIGAYSVSWAHVNMAYALLRQGDIQQARQMFEDSIHRMQKADLMIGLIYALEGLASLYVTQRQAEHAAQLFAWANAMREKLGDHRPPVEQASVERDLAVIHSQLNEAAFENAYNTGRAMTVEQAITLALEK